MPSNILLYLAVIIKRYFPTYFTSTCFGSLLWSHLQAELLKCIVEINKLTTRIYLYLYNAFLILSHKMAP